MPEPKHHTAVIDTERDLRQQNEALRKALEAALWLMPNETNDTIHYWEHNVAIDAMRAHAESLLAEKI